MRAQCLGLGEQLRLGFSGKALLHVGQRLQRIGLRAASDLHAGQAQHRRGRLERAVLAELDRALEGLRRHVELAVLGRGAPQRCLACR